MKRDGDTVCLYVQDCTPEDSGIYRCIASNKEGQDTCDAQLQVVDKMYDFPINHFYLLFQTCYTECTYENKFLEHKLQLDFPQYYCPL